MALSKQAAERYVYQIKVTLMGSEPPIWRRIQVSSDTSLHRFHEILQVVMGWTDSHLHQFIIGGSYFPDPECDPDLANEKAIKLSQVFSKVNDRSIYEYDFGDNWEHEIIIEKILPVTAESPVCLMGQRACPHEDCGGIRSYAKFLEAIQSVEHPEHYEMLSWADGSFDPEVFDLNEINRKIASCQKTAAATGTSRSVPVGGGG